MEAAFIFGQIGDLVEFLGRGWSVEENFAWATGAESHLALPLPGDDKPYTLSFNLHPLINPAGRNSQRVVFLAGPEVLGRFEVKERDTVELDLPLHVTAGRTRIDLTLIHGFMSRTR